VETISVSQLKARLSAELRKVKNGARTVVLEHNRPVAILSPYKAKPLLVRKATGEYAPGELTPLVSRDPLELLSEDREDRW
jgi:antitoxin (DNA-binding transcriptional repressor) of toxin-antitoxin stability system